MATLTLCELLQYHQKETKFNNYIRFTTENSTKKADFLASIPKKYHNKILFQEINTPEVQDSSQIIIINKSKEARTYLPALCICMAEDTGIDFNKHSPVEVAYPGFSTKLVITNFKNKLHLLAELHGTNKIFYHCSMAIRWGNDPDKVICVEGVTEGTFVPSTEGEGLIDRQFVPDGQSRTIAQMSPEERQEHHPRFKLMRKVLEILEENGLEADDE